MALNLSFTHVVAFELEEKAEALRQALIPAPHQVVQVVGGDCNQRIEEAVRGWENTGDFRSGPRLGPALAYIDPDKHTDLTWHLVQTLAQAGCNMPRGVFKRPRPMELLILFPTGTMRRTLPVKAGSKPATQAGRGVVDAMFGNQDWVPIYEAQRAGILKGDSGWQVYVDLYRLQLQALGYTHVAAIEVTNTRNVVLYHLVFASNHDVGGKLFNEVLERAKTELPKLIEDERKRKQEADAPAEGMFTTAELEALVDMDISRAAKLLNYPPVPLAEVIAAAKEDRTPDTRDAKAPPGVQLGLFADRD